MIKSLVCYLISFMPFGSTATENDDLEGALEGMIKRVEKELGVDAQEFAEI